MPAHVQHFVLHIRAGLRIQRADLELEALPLSLVCSSLSVNGIVCAVDKAKVRRYLIHSFLRNKSRLRKKGECRT